MKRDTYCAIYAASYVITSYQILRIIKDEILMLQNTDANTNQSYGRILYFNENYFFRFRLYFLLVQVK